PASLLPDFRPGGGVMRIRVIGIIELIEQLSFATIRHLQRQIARTFHALLFGDKNQFNNPDNPYAHYTTTGPEIWQQTGGRITHFVSSMGTTGTITGVSRFMREQSKPVTIVGLQPEEGSSIPGIRRWPAEYLPGIFNASLVDEVLDIHQREAENTMRELAVREGIFCGVSSGGAVAGALRVAKANPGAVVVAIICDRGDRYLSTGVFGEEHFSQGAGI
ncbi:pyridoxal-phosphate dependent enzyme, partial [Escherichia coli]|uniref:pyridoxal-phosphate dependent enzyme n=1 Tax=Escherichia coli TaxID=562 RepID=UPI00201ADAE3